MNDWDRAKQYEDALATAAFCLWVAQAIADGRELPHLTATLPAEWAVAAKSLHCEDRFHKQGRLIRLRKETAHDDCLSRAH